MPSPEEPVLDGAAEVSPLQTSPTKEWYKQKVHESANEVQQLKKKVKTLHQKKRRLSKRIDASQDLIEQLKEQNLLSEKGLEVFQASFSPDIQQLLKRTHEKTNKYPPELRAFALTLHYYSPRAYDYVRAKFNNAFILLFSSPGSILQLLTPFLKFCFHCIFSSGTSAVRLQCKHIIRTDILSHHL